MSHMSCYSDDIIVTKSQYDDFSMPCAWRNFELIVEGQVLYVNPGWLAELSPSFFGHFCFDRNRDREPLNIEDVTYDDMLEFFRCIFFCPTRKPITVKNVALVMGLANRFDMRPVMARCEHFVSRTAPTLDRDRLFQVTCALSHTDPNCSTMSILVDRLASMKKEDLQDLQFNKMKGEVVAEVYNQKINRKKEKRQRFCCIM